MQKFTTVFLALSFLLVVSVEGGLVKDFLGSLTGRKTTTRPTSAPAQTSTEPIQMGREDHEAFCKNIVEQANQNKLNRLLTKEEMECINRRIINAPNRAVKCPEGYKSQNGECKEML